MNAYQESVFLMAKEVREVCEKHQYIWSENDSFAREYLNFKETLAGLDELCKNEDRERNGQLKTRKLKRDILEAAGYLIANRLQIFAIQHNDKALLEAVNYNLIHFTRASESELLDTCRKIHETAKTFFIHLKDYKINPEVVDELDKTLSEFDKLLHSEAILTSGETLQQIRRAINDLVHSLEEPLDRHAYNMSTKFPDFYAEYQDARRINPPHMMLGLRVKVMDTATLMPIPSVEALVAPLSIKTESSKDGILEIDSIEPNSYEITLKKEGYRSLTLPIQVKPNETTQLQVKMEKGE